jgi:hypothetical protein
VRRFLTHPLVKRLPWLILVVIGIAIFKSGYLPAKRELVWRMPADPAIREVEVQLYDGDELLKREAFSLPKGPVGDLVEEIHLGRGQYVARLFVRRDGGAVQTAAVPFQVAGDEVIALPLIAR